MSKIYTNIEIVDEHANERVMKAISRPLIFISFGVIVFFSQFSKADISEKIPSELKLKRVFFSDSQIQTYGTFFYFENCWFTAKHVIDSMGDLSTTFPLGFQKSILDAAYSCEQLAIEKIKDVIQASSIYSGQKVRVLGYPAGSENLAERIGEVYLKRPNQDAWIGIIHSPDEPVVVGMSGGIVLEIDSNKVLGILITRNSPADLDADGKLDNSFDFISLDDI